MKKLPLIVLTILVVVIAATAFADDDNRQCKTPAEECVQKIRETMTGRMFLGVIFYDSDEGIYVKSVVAGGPAYDAGIRGGDFIVGIEGRDISDGNVKAFKGIFGKAQKKGKVALKIKRGETIISTTATLTEITEEQITRIIDAHLEAGHSHNKVSSVGPPAQP